MKLYKVKGPCYFVTGSICTIIHNDGSAMPLIRGMVQYSQCAVNQDLWGHRDALLRIPSTEENLRAFKKQMKHLRRAVRNCQP